MKDLTTFKKKEIFNFRLKKKIKRNRFSSNITLYAMCSIPMLLIFVFNYIPMFGLIIAFKDFRYDLGIFGSEWVGFENFEFFLKSNDFYRVTKNTLVRRL